MMVHSAALLPGASVTRAWPSWSSHLDKDEELLLASDLTHTRQTPTGCLQWALIREAEKFLAAWNLAPAALKMGHGEWCVVLAHAHKHLRAPAGQDLHLSWPQSCILHLCGALRADIKFFRDSTLPSQTGTAFPIASTTRGNELNHVHALSSLLSEGF